ncbi:MAG TPA: hypothetical protein VGO75_03805 [Gemmatimonadaceae bacterium]|jgi:uncharacterized membrane protein|nr:hypothetical protein [Gemmatimonadaceae bacterium]
MKMTRLIAALALITAATACTAERTVAPKPVASSFVATLATPPQLPLLFVVDGVKYQRDQVPTLTSDQVFAVRVIKGHAALKQYGPDASYGVVVITTKQGAAPRS